MPRPAKHQPPVWLNLAVDAADFVVLAVIGIEADAVAPADPCIDAGPLGAGLDPRGSKPPDYFLRLGPGRKAFLRPRLETPREGEARSGDVVAGSADGA